MSMIILIRYGEIHLKGQNRPYFERLLMGEIRNAVKKFPGAVVERGDGRYYVENFDEADGEDIIAALSKVFGIHSLTPAYEVEKDIDAIAAEAIRQMDEYILENGKKSYKVDTKRSDKRFPMKSNEISAEIGGRILEHDPSLTVDIHKPEMRVFVEIRDKAAYVYTKVIPGQGGMPIGSNGKAMLLISGGIDSPVAGHMVAKRGVRLSAVHYYSFPYTSERARDKVIELTKQVAAYAGEIKLHLVHFTDIQMAIYEKCPHQHLTLIMRRFMMRIADRLARESGMQAVVTGESIGQVASQTIESLAVTDSVVELPVFRPLIGMDKIEIIERAQQIGTYETSILPYEDCCTVFVPKHPTTRPNMESIIKSESVLDVDALIEDALSKSEVIIVNAD
ncbi:MAG: tRNA 4-thiouridine(8) synthase ThiI [Christensenellaceae bacterium]|nr:tRNA 4-thiouridine(8) synthase ThiI [Christensenellaceae bacterium]